MFVHDWCSCNITDSLAWYKCRVITFYGFYQRYCAYDICIIIYNKFDIYHWLTFVQNCQYNPNPAGKPVIFALNKIVLISVAWVTFRASTKWFSCVWYYLHSSKFKLARTDLLDVLCEASSGARGCKLNFYHIVLYLSHSCLNTHCKMVFLWEQKYIYIYK